MLFANMVFQSLDLLAVQVKEFTALLTFKVITFAVFDMSVFADVFVAGRTLSVDGVLFKDTFINELLKSSVYG